MAVSAILYDEAGSSHYVAEPESIATAFAEARGLLWIHVTHTDEADAAFLRDRLGLHPLPVEDCLNDRYQRPKLDDFGDYLFLTLHGVDYARSSEVVTTTELDLFLGRTWVITAALEDLPGVDHLFETPDLHPRLFGRGAPLLAHGLIDALVDSYLPVLDRMADVTDAIEEESLERPHEALLEHIVRLKRSTLRLHRVTVPQRDLLLAMSRGDYALLGDAHGIYFHDVYDHLVRIEDLTTGLRERADNAVTTYLSAVSIRQNESMRVLAIVAAIFLPLSLLTGIYGMNFQHMPELDTRYGYFVVLAVIVIVVAVGSWIVWMRAWLSAHRRRLTRVVSYAVDPRVLRDAAAEAARLRPRLLNPRRLASPSRDGADADDDR